MRGLAPHFQIELSTNGRMDEMTVHVEAPPQVLPKSPRRRRARSWRSTSRVVGITARINVPNPARRGALEGKAKRVVDNRNQGVRPWPGLDRQGS
jgi:phenylacetate-CoA ligase